MERKRIRTGLLALTLLLCGCAGAERTEPASEGGSAESTPSDASSAETVSFSYDGTEAFDSTTFSNGDGKMGDADGPAYCVYSVRGTQGAEMEVELSQAEVGIYREDGRHVNAYVFLGADVYDPDGGYWINCADAGLVYSDRAGWHLFYNLYSVEDPENTPTWYESARHLRPDRDYRLTLRSDEKDGTAVLTVTDLTTGKAADRATFELRGAKADGSNTAYLTDFALDYPDDVKQGPDGAPSDDWVQITLGNTDRGLYLRNLRVKNCGLLRDGETVGWSEALTANRGIWPDASIAIGYPCAAVRCADENYSYIVDLDMNR